MIVDDTKDIVDMVKKILECEGFKTIDASNGKEALNLLKQSNTKPDLVLVDMFMPGMSGRELCERIREDEALKDIKLAFLTVAAFRDHGKQVLKKLDILDYIVKPFDVDDFVRRIRKII
jgi:CheY-like chemotaxis protein